MLVELLLHCFVCWLVVKLCVCVFGCWVVLVVVCWVVVSVGWLLCCCVYWLVGLLVGWLLDYSVGNEISSFHSFVSLPLIFQGIYTLISQILPYRTRTEGESRGAACATLQGRGFES